MVTIWNFVFDVFDSMQMIYMDIIEWFSTEFNFGSLGTWTISEMCFGGGLVLLLGFMIAKFLL